MDRGKIPVTVTGMAAALVWQRIVLRANLSRIANGSMTICKDGAKVFENLAMPFGTNDAIGPYIKLSNYSVPKLPDGVSRRVRWAVPGAVAVLARGPGGEPAAALLIGSRNLGLRGVSRAPLPQPSRGRCQVYRRGTSLGR